MTEEMKQFFNNCADTWDEHSVCDPNKIAAIVTLAGIGQGAVVADIACGTGVLFPELLSRDPASILGIDLSDGMIAKARGKFNDPRLRLLACDVFDVRETGFDAVVIFSAYPHFKDKRALAKQAYGMLKDGGRLMVAHCEGREAINGCHRGQAVSRISWPLRPVEEEAAEFAGYFTMDILADAPEIYLFSGVKKPMADSLEEQTHA